MGTTIREARPCVGAEAASPRGAMLRIVRLLLLVGVAWLAGMALHGSAPEWLAGAESRPMTLMTACALYGVLLAVPFVPAVEIGLMIMLVFGPWGALGAYLATVAGLNVAFLAGRVLGRRAQRPIPESTRWLLPPPITAGARVRSALTLAMLLNLPGNAMIGGGGGIAMAFAAWRLLPWRWFALAVSLATGVVPLLFVLGVAGAERIVPAALSGAGD